MQPPFHPRDPLHGSSIDCSILQVQRYEGASTVFGPHTLQAYINQFTKLSEYLAKVVPHIVSRKNRFASWNKILTKFQFFGDEIEVT